MEKTKAYLTVKGTIKSLAVCLVLIGPSLFIAAPTKAAGPADFLDKPLEVKSTNNAFFDNYKVARYLETLLLCMNEKDSGDDSGDDGNTIVGTVSPSDAGEFKIFRNIAEGRDEFKVGHEIDPEHGNLSCNQIQIASKNRIANLFGNDIMNFVNLFYKLNASNGQYELFNQKQVASDLLAKPYFQPLHDGDVQNARLAVAFSRCFDEAPTGVSLKETRYPELGKAYIFWNGADENRGIGIGKGFVASVNFDDQEAKCSELVQLAINHDLVKFMADHKMRTGTIRNSPQELFNLIGSEGTEEISKGDAIADISGELADPANSLLLAKCLAESAESGHIYKYRFNKDGSAVTIRGDKNNAIKVGADEFKKAFSDGTLSQAQTTSAIADWLVLGNESGARVDGWLRLPGTGGDPWTSGMLIESDGLGVLQGCIVDSIDSVSAILKKAAIDIDKIKADYEANKDKGAGQTGGSTGETDPCLSKGDSFISWLACPLINLIDSFLDGIRNTLSTLLQFSIEDSGSGTASNLGDLKDAWNVFRGIASILIIIFFLTALLVKSIKGE